MKTVDLSFFLTIIMCLMPLLIYAQNKETADVNFVVKKIIENGQCRESNAPSSYISTGYWSINRMKLPLTSVFHEGSELTMVSVNDNLVMSLSVPDGEWRMSPADGKYNPERLGPKATSGICEFYDKYPDRISAYYYEKRWWYDSPVYKMEFKNNAGTVITKYFDAENFQLLAYNVKASTATTWNVIEEWKYFHGYKMPSKIKTSRTEKSGSYEGYIVLEDVKLNPVGVESFFNVEQYKGINKVPKQYRNLTEMIMDRVLGLPEDLQERVLAEPMQDYSDEEPSVNCGEVKYKSDRTECNVDIELLHVQCNTSKSGDLYFWTKADESNCDLQLSNYKGDGYYERTLGSDIYHGKNLNVAIEKFCRCN